jgi:hypothetical protein
MPNFAKLWNARFWLTFNRSCLLCYLTCCSTIFTRFRTFRNKYLYSRYSRQLISTHSVLLISLSNRDYFLLNFLLYLLFNLLNFFLFESVLLSASLDLVLDHTDIFVSSVNILKHALLLNCDRFLQSLEQLLIFLLSLSLLATFFLKLCGLVLKDGVRLY